MGTIPVYIAEDSCPACTKLPRDWILNMSVKCNRGYESIALTSGRVAVRLIHPKSQAFHWLVY